MIPSRVHVLLAHLVDYAGTFPPANLTLDAAASTYAREQDGPDAWLLGRFVIGADNLDRIANGPSFDVSVIAGSDADAALAHAAAFNAGSGGRARIASIEFSPAAPSGIASLVRRTALAGAGIEAFFETPVDGDLGARLDAIARAGAAAKLRTGGVTPAAIAGPAAIADFLVECAERRLPFKATAGLHHAVRSCYPLTYERGSPTAVMHGFLNLVASSALAASGERRSEIAAVLEESSPHALMQTALRHDPGETRRFFRSFGSCSFREPAEELAEILAHWPI